MNIYIIKNDTNYTVYIVASNLKEALKSKIKKEEFKD